MSCRLGLWQLEIVAQQTWDQFKLAKENSMKNTLIVCLLLIVIGTCSYGSEKPSRILFVTQSKGFTHGSVRRPKETLAPAEVAMIQLGEQSKLFSVDCTQDCEADFTKENLQNYDIVAFYTTGNLPIAKDDLDYFFNEWLPTEGHGVLGFHSAADTFHNYEPYWDMIGGTFIGHPWGAGTKIVLSNHEPENPLVSSFGKLALPCALA